MLIKTSWYVVLSVRLWYGYDILDWWPDCQDKHGDPPEYASRRWLSIVVPLWVSLRSTYISLLPTSYVKLKGSVTTFVSAHEFLDRFQIKTYSGEDRSQLFWFKLVYKTNSEQNYFLSRKYFINREKLP